MSARGTIADAAGRLLAQLNGADHRADYLAPDAHDPSDVWRPRARSLGELLADPHVTAPPRWVLPPLVEGGEVALLSAPPKTGKSHLASQLAAELSRGGAALDGTPLAAAPVLWLGLDEPARRLAPRLAMLGADPGPGRFVVVEREPGHVLTAAHLAVLLAEYVPALVVLDTTSQLALDARVDPNDGAQVGAFLRPLVDTVRQANAPGRPCAGLFLHHAPHHAARAAGSLQWAAIVDAAVVLRRRHRRADPGAPEPDDDGDDAAGGDDGTRFLEGTTRAGGPLRLRLTFAAGRYSLAGAPVPLVDRLRAELAQLDCGPGVSSAARLRDRLNCQDAALRAALDTLEHRGEVRPVGTRTSPTHHYVPTPALSLYLTQGEGAGGSAAEGGRSGESPREEVAPTGDTPAPHTSSAVHAPTRARGKKSGRGAAPGAADATPPAVLGEYGDGA